jgi:hypothetical protein
MCLMVERLGYGTEGPWFETCWGQKIFIFSKTFGPALASI